MGEMRPESPLSSSVPNAVPRSVDGAVGEADPAWSQGIHRRLADAEARAVGAESRAARLEEELAVARSRIAELEKENSKLGAVRIPEKSPAEIP